MMIIYRFFKGNIVIYVCVLAVISDSFALCVKLPERQIGLFENVELSL